MRAYSLNVFEIAKQRYNKRVIAGVKSFLSLDARDLSQVEAFFSSPEEGGWEDLSAAGYLLANAFRTSSTKAPDSLPSVKVYGIYGLLYFLSFILIHFLSQRLFFFAFVIIRNGKHLRKRWNLFRGRCLRRMARKLLHLTKMQRKSWMHI